MFDETKEVLCQSITIAKTLNFDEENDVEKWEELLSCPPRCPWNRRSIPTVFNASKTDEESGFKVPFLLRVS